MKDLKDKIFEKLVINKDSKSAKHPILTQDNLNLIQKVFRFYIDNFVSEITIKKICKTGTVDKERYDYTINEINDIITTAQRENRSVVSILFNNKFKDKDDIKQISELFDSIIKETDKSFIQQIKDELMDAFETVDFWRNKH